METQIQTLILVNNKNPEKLRNLEKLIMEGWYIIGIYSAQMHDNSFDHTFKLERSL